jgi:hypothetical protein
VAAYVLLGAVLAFVSVYLVRETFRTDLDTEITDGRATVGRTA